MTDKCYELESQGESSISLLLNINQEKIGSGKGEEMTNINFEKYGAYIPEIISVNKIKI